ncbi:SDR family NAD(P)-dependent oxidoreductase [Mycolicibacterium sphagni]|nr:SDR family NAD(P)-dependent oxidoreductase [Mycolicibacterium sphagni]
MSDRCVVIGGATRGVGPAVSQRLAATGVSLVLADNCSVALTRLAQRIEDNSEAPVITSTDGYLSLAGAERAAQQAFDTFGRIDAVVIVLSAEDCRVESGNPLWSILRFVLTVIPTMLAAGTGRVIVIKAADAPDNLNQRATDAMAHGGLCAMVASLAREFGSRGITFNVVDVGDRPFRESQCAAEVAALVEFLAGTESAIVNGQVFGGSAFRR